MSRAVVSCFEFGRPDAFLKVVLDMPRLRAFSVMSRAKFVTVPPRFSATTAATSFADLVTSALIASCTRID